MAAVLLAFLRVLQLELAETLRAASGAGALRAAWPQAVLQAAGAVAPVARALALQLEPAETTWRLAAAQV